MMESFADIEGPVRIGLLQLLLIWSLGLLLAALLGTLLWRLFRKRSAREAGPDVPLRSPREIAFERLQRLRGDPAGLEAEPFTVEVSDIVRQFLEAALKIPAREQTSEEFLTAVQSDPALPEVLREHMPPFLDQCDRVKFARQALAGEQRERLLQTAESVIAETDQDLRPAPPESSQPAATA
jgi:hypothetical protein